MDDQGAPQETAQNPTPPTRLATPFDAPMTISTDHSELNQAPSASANSDFTGYSHPPRWSWKSKLALGLLVVALLVIGVILLLRRGERVTPLQIGKFTTIRLPLSDLVTPATQTSGQELRVNGALRLNKSVILTPTSQPTAPFAGELYFDQTTNQLSYYNGTQFVGVGGSSLIQNTVNNTGNTTNIFTGGGNTGNITGVGGLTNVLPKFTGGQSLGNSIVTDNGSNIAVNGNVNLVSAASTGTEITLYAPSITPTNLDNPFDTQALELGFKFRADINGIIEGIRYYKGPNNTGTHSGSLWTSGGTLLATATFTGETASGWQEVRFSTPVSIAADTTYVASYHTDVGRYAFDSAYFALNGVDNGPLHALQDGVDGGNGVFRVTNLSAFPNNTSNANSYWVDVIYTPSQNPAQYQIDGAVISSINLANNADIAKRSGGQVFTGYNTFRSGVNAAKAFNIQAADTTSLFQVDTLNMQIVIGGTGNTTTPVLLILANKTTANDPIGVEGAVYYNSALRSFRCFKGGVWDDCGSLSVDHGFTVYDEFLGGTTSLAGSGIGSLNWNALAIGASGTLAFNPATPTPVADRPGVLALQTPAVANQGTTLLLGNNTGGSMLISKDNAVKAAVAVGATANQVLRIGLHSQTTATTQPISGVWWEADPSAHANWRYCFGNGAAAICNPSAVPIAANTWVSLEIRVSATGSGTSAATYLINGTSFLAAATTIDSTNRVSPALSCYTATGAAQNCYWDYFQLKGTTAATR